MTATSAGRSASVRRDHPYRHLVARGLLATLVAMAAVVVVAALAAAVGVTFEVPDGGPAIPLPGFGTMTGIFSVVGIAIAAALRRWSARPATRFVQVAVTLTALSLVAPLVSGGSTSTVVALMVLHLVAASVMIPSLTRVIRA
jgi:uncharacterized protein DUF6069